MLQIQELPAQLRARVRDPAWRLQLLAGEDLHVEPVGAQTLRSRQTVQWVIRIEDDDDTEACVMVRARLAGARGRVLRWMISSTAADLPLIHLPLGQSYLERIQLYLAHTQQQLHLGIASLKNLRAAPGLSSDARAAISAQRKAMETQLKLATRILELASQASQLAGLLDGQMEVAAELLDLSDEGSPPLLQFGTIKSTSTRNGAEQTQAEAEAASADQ